MKIRHTDYIMLFLINEIIVVLEKYDAGEAF